MKNTSQVFRLSAVAAALTSVFTLALADDAEMAQLTKPESEISIGVGAWSNERHQLGIYDGQSDNAIKLNGDLRIVKRDDATGTWTSFSGTNLGLDTANVRGEYLQQGNLGIFLEYDQIVRDNPNTFRTGLQGIGTNSMLISGNGVNALPKGNITLGTKREATQIGAYKNLAEGLDLNVSFKNEDKNGSRHWGMGSNPYFLAEPIDYNTRQLDAVLNFTGERIQLSGGYSGSWFQNTNNLVIARINGAATPGSTQSPNPTPLTTPLDNQAHQLFLNGGYSFTEATRGTIKLSYTTATQDENLPTYDLAAPNNRFNGAPRSLDGQIDTTLVQVGVTSRPIQKLSLVAEARYQDVDDKTPLNGFVGSNTTGAITVHNTPHSITTTSGKLEGTYQLPYLLSLTGGVDYREQDRSYPLFEAERYVPFRATLEETSYRLQLRRSLGETVNGSIALIQSDREGSAYLATEHFPSDLINPIHIADRERTKVRVAVDWAPADAVSVQAVYEDAQDDYGNDASRPYGLRDGDFSLYSLDASYKLNDNWNVSAWYSHDQTRANQYGARWDRVTETYELDKEYHLKDTSDSLGIGTRGKLLTRLSVGGDLQWTRNQSEYRDRITTTGIGATVTPTPAVVGGTTARTTVALPDIENKVLKIALFAQYAIEKQADIRVDYIHERWHTNDWSYTNGAGTAFLYGGNAGTAVDGTTVLAAQRQNSDFVGVRYIYRFQ